MSFNVQFGFVCIAAALAVWYSGKSNLICRKLTALIHGKTGCSPIPDVGNVTIHYFEGRGRAEAMRLLMEEMSVPYTEINFNKETWPAYKIKGTNSGLYTFGQAPAIETSSGVRLVQSQAILHHLARSTGLDCDCELLHHCEMIAGGVEDARSRLGKMLYNPNFSLADRAEYITDTLPLWLGYFEKLAPSLAHQVDAYFVGDRLTWVDFMVFDLLEANMDFISYKLDTDQVFTVNEVFEPFPKLLNFFRQFSRRPNIAKFVKSKRRFPYKIPQLPK